MEGCPNLTTLDLTGFDIGDDGFISIATALTTIWQGSTCRHKLRIFACNENRIGNLGAEALATTLLHCRSLVVIDLHGNSVGDVGAMAFANALRRNNTQECLKLHGNDITELGVMAFGSALVTDNHTITILWLGQQSGQSRFQLDNSPVNIRSLCRKNNRLKTLTVHQKPFYSSGPIPGLFPRYLAALDVKPHPDVPFAAVRNYDWS